MLPYQGRIYCAVYCDTLNKLLYNEATNFAIKVYQNFLLSARLLVKAKKDLLFIYTHTFFLKYI